MKKYSIFIFLLSFISCSSNSEDEPKACNCSLQQYKRTVVTKKNSDGSHYTYSDTGWNKNGSPDPDSEKDCAKNDQIKFTTTQTDISTEYQRDIYLKWVYICN